MSKVLKNPYILVFLIQSVLSILLCYFLLFKGNGFVVYVDVTEGQTFSNSVNKFLYTFDDNWGESIAEKQRLVPMVILISLFKVLFLDQQNFVPLKFLLFYILTNISFVLSCYILQKTLKLNVTSKVLFLALLLSSTFYLYNPWMTNRLMHFFLFLTSFTIPLAFSLTFKYFYNTQKNYYLVPLIGLLLGLWTTTPHTFLIYSIMCLPFIFFALYKKLFYRLVIYLSGVFITTLLTGAFWILPFLFSNATPDRLESIDIFRMLSKNASIFNNLKLQGYWWPGLPSYSFQLGVVYDYLFNVLYLFPVFILIFLLFSKQVPKSLKFILGLISLLSLFFSSYQSSYFIYDFVVFNTPLQKIGWLFRETEKIAYLLALAYSFSFFIIILFYKRSLKFIISLLIIPLLVSYLGYTFFLMKSNLNKVTVPVAYIQVNNLISKDKEIFNVGIYPQVQYSSWSNMDASNYFINLSLNKPVVPTSEQDSRTKYYFNYLLNETNLPVLDVSRGLSLLGVKYLVIRNDLKYQKTDNLITILNTKEGMQNIGNFGDLVVYKNLNYKGLAYQSDVSIVTNLGLSALKDLYIAGINSDNYTLNYLDLSPLSLNKKAVLLLDLNGYIDLAVNSFINKFAFPSQFIIKTDPNPSFAKLSLVDKTHGESTFYFNNNQIKTGNFNFDKEVAFSMGGAEINHETLSYFSKHLPLNFENGNFYNIYKDIFGNLTLKYQGITTNSVWDIVESNPIKVNASKAILLDGEVTAPYILEPHVKFSYYNASNQLLETQAFYPNYNYKIHVVSRIPVGSVTYKVSLWSRQSILNTLPFEFKDLSLTDVSDNYKDPTLSFYYKNTCSKNCIALARIIKSPKGGTLNFKINGENHFVNTLIEQDMGGFYWEPISQISGDDLNIEVINIKGVNGLAVFFTVNKEEYEKAILKSSLLMSAYPKKINFNNEAYLYYTDSLLNFIIPTNIHVTKVSPVEYKVSGLKQGSDITFGKPYSKNWSFNGSGSNLYNGFVNGWVTDSKEGFIYYEPQKYFYYGILISFISSLVTLGLILKLKNT